MSQQTASEDRCAICGEQAEAALLQECFHCGRTFHLNPYNNQPGQDCGDALIGESLGVHYLCDICIEAANNEASGETSSSAATAPSPPPPAPTRETPRRRYRRQDPS